MSFDALCLTSFKLPYKLAELIRMLPAGRENAKPQPVRRPHTHHADLHGFLRRLCLSHLVRLWETTRKSG
ncbi:hypothetical protein predicted by Glimmer/Critica [Acetobacter senegalensis]|uniref:Uncharacterized protein n=1 Tax=Acetobacter senegalensis TaxID=446692 RepID=A0A0U5EV75_9PROT|nr:hypothetical protein predicted by Glimmer/Critica [Acetobacter senegalensis]